MCVYIRSSFVSSKTLLFTVDLEWLSDVPYQFGSLVVCASSETFYLASGCIVLYIFDIVIYSAVYCNDHASREIST